MASDIFLRPMDLFAEDGNGSHSGGIKLFGVTLRKSASLGDLCYNTMPDLQHNSEGYITDGFVQNVSRPAPRKRGVPWTEEEHRLFLKGLEKLGKGDWRGISRNFVKSRTPTQVASHAQKYYLRQKHVTRKQRRSSLFDICHDHHKVQMVLGTSPDVNQGLLFDENGSGLNLSIAPPSVELCRGNISLNHNSAIRVV